MSFQLPIHNQRGARNQSSIIATELVPIVLRCGSVDIWSNPLVNSPLGICQLRLAYEKEDDGNLKKYMDS